MGPDAALWSLEEVAQLDPSLLAILDAQKRQSPSPREEVPLAPHDAVAERGELEQFK